MKPVIAISLGCPSGIGPEVAVAAAAEFDSAARIVLVGDRWVVERAAGVVGVAKSRLVPIDPAKPLARQWTRRGAIGYLVGATQVAQARAPFGKPTADAGRAQLAWIDEATDLVTSRRAHALVTGPVSKHAIAESGGRAKDFRGHTEYLAERLGAPEVVMAFWAEKLVVSLVTTHLALARVSRAITRAAVATSTFHTVQLVKRLGKRSPRVAISGLNPHAGEQGLLGKEEIVAIEPGIGDARRRLEKAGVRGRLFGPIGAETAIRKAYGGSYDAVVAMYHDQATIPMKLVGFGDGVNVTLGLPIVRTSVDHGTGYDIAGTGRADARGMSAAIALGVRLALKGR